MLDELKEYEQYTFDLDGGIPPDYRLREKTFLKSFSGLPRAMTTIARGCLFPLGDEAALGLEVVENVLRHWCGFAGEGDDALPPKLAHLDRWVPRYIALLESSGDEGESKTVDKWLEKDENGNASGQRAKRLDRGLFEGRSDADDRNMAFYERAIAEAVRLGPLKQRVLVRNRLDGDVPGDEGGDAAFNGVGGRSFRNHAQSKRFEKANRKYVLALTAVFLAQNNGLALDAAEDGWLYANVSLGRVTDWTLQKSEKPARKTVLGWLYGGSPLFDAVPLGLSDSMWRMRSAWVEDCNWRIVDAGSVEGECVVYKEVPFRDCDPGKTNMNYYPFALPKIMEA